MRRPLLAAAVLLVLVAATSALAFTARERSAPWVLLGVSADGRSLVLGYESGGCLLDDGRPVVAESARRIVVTVRQTDRVPGDGEACPADLRLGRVSARVKGALNGRRVRGGPRFHERFVMPERVPRVVGLDRRDAGAALRAQAFRVRTVGQDRRGTVIRQRPRAGTPTRPGPGQPAVRLRVR